jgi:hypothetical protein
VDGLVGGDLVGRLTATDRLHGDPGLELVAVNTALAHWWEPRSGKKPRPPQRLTMGPVRKNQSVHLTCEKHTSSLLYYEDALVIHMTNPTGAIRETDSAVIIDRVNRLYLLARYKLFKIKRIKFVIT